MGGVGVNGGAIVNGGTLTVANSTIDRQSRHRGGGGIYNTGTLTVANSTLYGNVGDKGWRWRLQFQRHADGD